MILCLVLNYMPFDTLAYGDEAPKNNENQIGNYFEVIEENTSEGESVYLESGENSPSLYGSTEKTYDPNGDGVSDVIVNKTIAPAGKEKLFYITLCVTTRNRLTPHFAVQ